MVWLNIQHSFVRPILSVANAMPTLISVACSDVTAGTVMDSIVRSLPMNTGLSFFPSHSSILFAT